MFNPRPWPFGLASMSSKKRAARHRRLTRPAVEGLEARLVLSTYQVTSLADVASSASNYDGTLRWAIQNANTDGAQRLGPDTITFAAGLHGTVILTQGDLTLSAGNTTIDGPGASLLTVSGEKANTAFVVDAGVVATISELTLSNGVGANGGGLFNSGTATVNDCTLSDDSATGDGGGIYNMGALTVTSDTLSTDLAAEGGGIYNSGTLHVLSSIFSEDSAELGSEPVGASINGGGIDNVSGGTATVASSTISSDSATSANSNGGGIANGGTLTVTTSTLAGDSANVGGGIDNNTGLLTVVNCTLTNDSAVSGGGGGMVNTGTVTLNNTIVAGNAASNGDNDIQGALAVTGSNNLIGDGTGMTGISDGSNGNQVGSEATPINPLLGPLASNGGPTETVALLPGSPAIDRGSNALIPAGDTTDQRGYIRIANGVVDVGAYEFGAAPLGTPLTVKSTQDDVDFTSAAALTLRQAVSLADAGAGAASITFSSALAGQTITLTQGSLPLLNTSGTMTIPGPGASRLTLSGNLATPLFVVGSGVTAAITGMTATDARNSAIQNYGSLALSGMTISDSSGGSGGGLFNSGTATLSDCTVSGDTSTALGGGGIYNRGTLTLTNCTVSGDKASGGTASSYPYGGGIYNDGTITVTSSTISSDSAGGSGGGIYSERSLTLVNCTVSGDSAIGQGGGIDISGGGKATITNGTFSNDSVKYGFASGGGIYNDGTLTITNSTISDESVETDGAGIWNAGTATVTNTIFSNDSSQDDGAGIYNTGTLTVTNGAFSSDYVIDNGGGIDNYGTLTITNSTFSRDEANTGSGTDGGGGIQNEGTLALTNCTFFGDEASNGGAIYNTGRLTATNCTLSGSLVGDDGGGIDNVSGGTATLNNTIVAGNNFAGGDSDIQGALTASSSYNLIGVGAGMTGIANGVNGNQVGTTTNPINPLLGPLASNGGPTQTMALLPDSPAIDHGSNALIPNGVTTDQRGYIRIVNAVVDIGAYEFAAAPLGTPLIVNSTQDDVDFTSAAALTLRQAVSLADATTGGASITFSSALLGQTITLTEGSLKLSDASGTTTIEGPGANLLTISANGAGAIFDELPGATAALSGITLTEAKYSAIQEISSTLTLTEMIIFDSSGGSGGGIYNTGTLTVTNSTLSNDSAVAAGGGGTFDGGGIYNLGTLTISNSTLSGDYATSDGGGIFNGLGGTAIVTNCTLSNDGAGFGGGGIGNQGTLQVFDSTLSKDTAQWGGGGIYIAEGEVVLHNTIVAVNAGPDKDILGTLAVASSFNLIGDRKGMIGIANGKDGNQVGTAARPINPLLGPLTNNGGPTLTMIPHAGSRAINRGANSEIPSGVTTDQRGYARIVNGTVDIGAVEVQRHAKSALRSSSGRYERAALAREQQPMLGR